MAEPVLRVGQIKNISVFRVTLPYLNLLVKPRVFSCFLEKYIILCILKGKMPIKMHKIIYFLPFKMHKIIYFLPFKMHKIIHFFSRKKY